LQALTSVDIRDLKVFSKGKVRNVYDLGSQLLIVASDRISAFDHVLASGIPDKGKILTAISAFWFGRLRGVCRNHLVTVDVDEFPAPALAHRDLLRDRSMLVLKAERIDVECIVRGRLAGSAWKEYIATGQVSGVSLPWGLGLNSELERPIFTPSTKCDDGHDRNVTVGEMMETVGAQVGEFVMATSLMLFDEARRLLGAKGLALVDTKFEFGYLGDEIILIDEVLTPDSSRFLDVSAGPERATGLDKQFVRDYLERIGWDGGPPAPALPPDIVAEARRRYLVILEKLTGEMPRWAK
jgi:phosphoribosylaminoimidazole-succinocarboxamide synthase